MTLTAEKTERSYHLNVLIIFWVDCENQLRRNHVFRAILKMARSTDSHAITLGTRQNTTPVRINRHTSCAGSNPKPAVRIPVRMKMNPNRSKILTAMPANTSQRHCTMHRAMINGRSSAFAINFKTRYKTFARIITSPILSLLPDVNRQNSCYCFPDTFPPPMITRKRLLILV